MSWRHREAPPARSTRSTTSWSRCVERAPASRRASARSRAARPPTGPSAKRRSCAASRSNAARCRTSALRRACSARSSRRAARSRSRSASPTSGPRARSASRRCSSTSARRSRALPCASIDEVFRRCRVRRGAVRRGAGGELDRGRGRPHARPAARHAAEDLRRGRAARAAEPDVARPTTEARGKRDLLACAVPGAVPALAGAEPAAAPSASPVASNAEAARLAAKEDGAGGDRRRGRGRALRPEVLAAQHRGRAEQHHALPGARQARRRRPPAATRPRS